MAFVKRNSVDYNITEERRLEYKRVSEESRIAKLKALNGEGPKPFHDINKPIYNPNELMPQLRRSKFKALSLFSGGGGLDLGFDKAGFTHAASYEIIDIAAKTLKKNRPTWEVYGGAEGDVRKVSWKKYKKEVDVIHGGPPCQPFSIAGQRKGSLDERDMWPEFGRAVKEIKPKAFIAENVPGLMSKKFESYVQQVIYDELNDYNIISFKVNANDFGVPQKRSRVIFVGFKSKECFKLYSPPAPTHLFDRTIGVRAALGLPDIGADGIAPTIRSAFTGKRNTTSVLNSKASQKTWSDLGVWPNGVQLTRELARNFVTKDKSFRMSVKDVGLLQGFPEDWHFEGAVYQVLGQIGNSVPPVLAYNIANSVLKALNRYYLN